MTEERFKEIFDKYHQELLRYGYSLIGSIEESEDMVANAMIRLWGEDGVDDGDGVKFWLMKNIRFQCLDFFSKKKVKSKYLNYLFETSKSEEHYVEGRIMKKLLMDRIMAESENLCADQRQVFKLRMLGWENRDVRKMLNLTDDTALQRFSRAKKHLKLALS